MNTLNRRIKAVEKAIKAYSGGLITVFYKDGSTKQIYPGCAIKLCLDERDKIERFEEYQGGNNGGVIEGLVNALLI